MKFSAKIMSIIMFVALSCNAQQNYPPIPTPGRYTGSGDLAVDVPGTLDTLIRASDLIIDGTADKVLPSVRLGTIDPMSLETHSLISVNKVVRGELPEGQKSVAISEPGGSLDGYEVTVQNHTLVKSGERFILFLKPYRRLKPAKDLVGISIPMIVAGLHEKLQVDENLGMPLYIIVGSWSGKVQVDEKETVRFLPAASTILHSSDGLNVDKFVNTITDLISRMYHKPPQDYPAQVGPPPPGLHLPPAGLPQR